MSPPPHCPHRSVQKLGPKDSIEPKDFDWDDAAEGCRSIVVACLLGAVVWFFVAALFAAVL